MRRRRTEATTKPSPSKPRDVGSGTAAALTVRVIGPDPKLAAAISGPADRPAMAGVEKDVITPVEYAKDQNESTKHGSQA